MEDWADPEADPRDGHETPRKNGRRDSKPCQIPGMSIRGTTPGDVGTQQRAGGELEWSLGTGTMGEGVPRALQGWEAARWLCARTPHPSSVGQAQSCPSTLQELIPVPCPRLTSSRRQDPSCPVPPLLLSPHCASCPHPRGGGPARCPPGMGPAREAAGRSRCPGRCSGWSGCPAGASQRPAAVPGAQSGDGGPAGGEARGWESRARRGSQAARPWQGPQAAGGAQGARWWWEGRWRWHLCQCSPGTASAPCAGGWWGAPGHQHWGALPAPLAGASHHPHTSP